MLVPNGIVCTYPAWLEKAFAAHKERMKRIWDRANQPATNYGTKKTWAAEERDDAKVDRRVRWEASEKGKTPEVLSRSRGQMQDGASKESDGEGTIR